MDPGFGKGVHQGSRYMEKGVRSKAISYVSGLLKSNFLSGLHILVKSCSYKDSDSHD